MSSSIARQQTLALINGFWAAQVINAAVLLKIPDLLAGDFKSPADLAREAQVHAPSLFRLLRALVTLGLCDATDDGRFFLTEAGHFLRRDVQGSVRGRAILTGDVLWKWFSDLPRMVKTGERTQAVASGNDSFEALGSRPERLEAFQQAMIESSTLGLREAAKAYDFGRFDRVLDLGGGDGVVLAELLTANPGQIGAVCDLSYIEERAKNYLEAAGVGARSQFLAGDFFAGVPEGFDLYLMKFVIHDWDDDSARMILANARKAGGQDAVLVLLEHVVPETLRDTPEDQFVIRDDLTMMSVGGKERTASDYRELLAGAGWRLTGIIPSGASFCVIEGRPV
jgi:hypothetical protein